MGEVVLRTAANPIVNAEYFFGLYGWGKRLDGVVMGLVGRSLERIRLNFWCNTNLEPSGRYRIENTGCKLSEEYG